MSFSFQELSRFWNIGYIVKKNFLSEDLCDRAFEGVKRLDYRPIVRKVHASMLDVYRRQVSMAVEDATAIKEVHDRVADSAEGSNNLWEVNMDTWHTIRSVPGGKTQAVHRDFPSFQISRVYLRHHAVQGSVIIAIMNGTLFHVYPRCIGGQPEKGKRLTLQ
ncbi:hypothetical protein JG688_00015946 [Phytophthora aleatoria]|uniref:Uncharacterized protein n=1 Tax=Phytophthora aleatoria TaxID=2496075 RepID=A0A8J5LWI3_9STRA|nr:hypothetical protein JG688_00015946 [Phytophthora aleatoria]